jgi:hypothetical protein
MSSSIVEVTAPNGTARYYGWPDCGTSGPLEAGPDGQPQLKARHRALGWQVAKEPKKPKRETPARETGETPSP